MAELALAIVPLCLGAIKGIGLCRKKLKILRHHDREIKRLRKKFVTQTDIFLDECQLLFQNFHDPKEVEDMVENPNHDAWESPDLEEQIKFFLGRKHKNYNEIVEEIYGHVTCLNESLANAEDNSRSIKIKSAVNLMVNKTKYESSIEAIKEANQEVKRLRKTAANIKKCQTNVIVRSKPIPPLYQLVKQHSASFYEALRFWTCLQAQHLSHNVHLLLDSLPDSSLRIVVRYRTQNGWCQTDETLLLQVRSQSIRLLRLSMVNPGGPFEEERPSKLRRVRFEEDCTDSAKKISVQRAILSPALVESKTEDMTTSLNLCSSQDMCNQLCNHIQPSSPTISKTPSGYLDAPDNTRHQLIPLRDPADGFDPSRFGEPTPLSDVLTMPVDSHLSVPQQLRLALKLVEGVLQFQSTPWLRPSWRLQDLSYFWTGTDLAESLRTLHISSELAAPHLEPQHPDSLMEGVVQSPSELGDVQFARGIRNMTMHSLGMALLQVGRWSALDPDDIVKIRKLADSNRDSRLGPKYQKLTQKCLDCDFGFGNDLKDPKLQSAIYRDVVCELENLIHTLEGI